MMKVFTSVFVLDRVRPTFDDIELSLRIEQNHPEILEGVRRRIRELQAEIELRCDRPERGRA